MFTLHKFTPVDVCTWASGTRVTNAIVWSLSCLVFVICVFVLCECRGGRAIWYARQTIRSSSSSETTESEQVYLQGGSQGAFPRSLIRDSGSEEEEEVRRRGNEDRWWWRRARTGCIGIWQRENRDRGKWISGDNQIMRIRCYFLLHWKAFGFCWPRGRG